jgi:hypothetical protein
MVVARGKIKEDGGFACLAARASGKLPADISRQCRNADKAKDLSHRPLSQFIPLVAKVSQVFPAKSV